MPNSGIDQLQEPLRSIVRQIIADSGGKVTAGGWRSHETQARLYYNYIHGIGGQAKAAPPGHSMHEIGQAVDFGGDKELAISLARKYGLVANVPGEWWHFQLGSNVPYAKGSSPPGMQFNLDGATAQNPADVLANRLHAVLRIVGMNSLGQSDGLLNTASTLAADPLQVPSQDEMFAPMNSWADLLGPAFKAANGAIGMNRKAQGQYNSDPFTYSPPASTSAGLLQQYARSLFKQYGFSERDFPALVTLWNKESGWNPTAQNPHSTAFGIAQFLNGTWAGTGYNKSSDPTVQIKAGLQYIKARYGNPSAALNFHLRNNWY